jgi:hypothetical protein
MKVGDVIAKVKKTHNYGLYSFHEEGSPLGVGVLKGNKLSIDYSGSKVDATKVYPEK